MCPCPEVIKVAKRQGLDGLAITDHGTLMGSRVVQKLVKDNKIDLIIIPAMEIKTRSGDILALGISEEIPEKLSPVETLERIRDQNGISICAHPFQRSIVSHRRMEKDAWIHKLNENRKLLTGIETYNGGSTDAANYLADCLAEKLQMPKTGGSDAHILSHIGTGQTLVDSNHTVDGILEEIRKGRTKVGGVPFSFRDRQIKKYFFKMVQLIRRSVRRGFNHCVSKQPDLLFNIYRLET